MEALIDAADLPLVQGKRWNFSPGRPGTATERGRSGSVYWQRELIPLGRIIMGIVEDPDRQVSHINGDKLDFRRENLVVRTRSEVALARKPPKRWAGHAPYPDPDRPGVWRVPLRSHKLVL